MAREADSLRIDPAQAHWLLASFCTLQQKAFDPESLARECVPPLSSRKLEEIASRLGLEFSMLALPRDRALPVDKLPLALQLKEPFESGADGRLAEGAAADWVILLQVDDARALVAMRGATAPTIVPLQRRLNEQFLRGAANQAFVTEYVCGIETVKSLQLEPQLNRRYRDLLANYLNAAFKTRQLNNTYGTLAGGLEQLMSLLILALGAYMAAVPALPAYARARRRSVRGETAYARGVRERAARAPR